MYIHTVQYITCISISLVYFQDFVELVKVAPECRPTSPVVLNIVELLIKNAPQIMNLSDGSIFSDVRFPSHIHTYIFIHARLHAPLRHAHIETFHSIHINKFIYPRITFKVYMHTYIHTVQI
jgi:hypothetical protein